MNIRITDAFGEPVTTTWAEFSASNADALSADELASIEAELLADRSVLVGGGASPVFGLHRAN